MRWRQRRELQRKGDTLALLPYNFFSCYSYCHTVLFSLPAIIILSLRLKRQKEKARKKQLKKQGGQKKESSGSENTSDEDEDAEEAGSSAEEPQKKAKPEPIVVGCTVEI